MDFSTVVNESPNVIDPTQDLPHGCVNDNYYHSSVIASSCQARDIPLLICAEKIIDIEMNKIMISDSTITQIAKMYYSRFLDQCFQLFCLLFFTKNVSRFRQRQSISSKGRENETFSR
jgi:hypothetical protein